MSMTEMRPPGRTTRTISATATAGSTSHWSVRSGPRDVKGIVGLVEGARIADGETHVATRGPDVRTGNAQHSLGHVDPDDLPVVAEFLGEPERCLPEPAAHVKQSFTGSQAEVRSLP